MVRASPIVPIRRVLAEPLNARLGALAQLDARGRSELIRVAADRHEPLNLRWRAVIVMARLDHPAYAAEVDRARRSTDWFMRNAALVGVMAGDRDRSVRYARGALNDPALVVRTQAVRNLIHAGAREAEPELWRALDDRHNFSNRGDSLWIRAHVVEALAGWARPARATDFRRLLLDPDTRLHRWAIRGLERALGRRLSGPGDDVASARRRWLAHYKTPFI